MTEEFLPDDWEQHWGHFAESAESNPAQRYRTRLILARLGLGEAPARVVDIGSGQGDFCALVKRTSPNTEVLGLELSEAGCDMARRKVPAGTFLQRNLIDASAGAPPDFQGWATHAVCSEVLEHVDRPEMLLEGARDYLAPGCRLIVTVPGGPMSLFDRHIGHRRHYTRASLRRVLADAGFKVQVVSAAGFPFHNLYRLAVLLRGRRLIGDASGPSISRSMRSVTWAFNVLFRANLPRTPWGWQLIATALNEA